MIGSIRTAPAGAALLLCIGGCGESMRDAPTPADTDADFAAIRAVLDRVEQSFNAGDLDTAMTVFTDDAVILGQGEADVSGTSSIRTMYTAMLDQFDVDADLSTDEIEVFGDLAYERGTFTLKLTQKATGDVVLDTENRHIHIMKRQPDGSWKTWRMMVNSATPAPGAPAAPGAPGAP